MHLVMFDIDGTLLDSSGFEDDCYLSAVRDVFDIDVVNVDWTTYPHCTDGAIVHEIVRQQLQREPTTHDVEAVRRAFIRRVTAALNRPNTCTALPGVHDLLDELNCRADVHIAIATGGWGETAHLKLQTIGLDPTAFALATADDGHSREEIMRSAHQRAVSRAAASPTATNTTSQRVPTTSTPQSTATDIVPDYFHTITYLGDGIWDLRATEGLGWNFIGIGSKHAALRTAGAQYTFEHYLDQDQLFRAIGI